MESVRLQVIEAKNVSAMDRGGTSDPYAKVKCNFNRQTYKTKVIFKTLNPKWNEEFLFLEPPSNGSVSIRVWDKDRWSPDDFLGEIEVPLGKYCDGNSHDVWIKLLNEPSKKRNQDKSPGELHVRITAQLKNPPPNRTGSGSGSISGGSSPLSASRESLNTSDKKAVAKSIKDLYVFGKELGRGGFAIVNELKNKETGEIFAVKTVKKKGLRPDDLKILQREVAVMKKLKHPGIVQLIDVYDEDDFFYIILEIVRGGELFDKIVERGFFSEKDAADVVQQILSAVAYMHSNGVTHRDLKPENLLCSGGEHDIIKIADFGLSKEGNNLQTACGSPGYVAPEILLGVDYDNSVDVWSVGIIAYVLLCGYPPFYAENPADVYRLIIEVKYEFLEPEWNDISSSAKNFIKQILVKNPSDRPSAQELLDHPWLKEASAKNLDAVRGNLIKHK